MGYRALDEDEQSTATEAVFMELLEAWTDAEEEHISERSVFFAEDRARLRETKAEWVRKYKEARSV